MNLIQTRMYGNKDQHEWTVFPWLWLYNCTGVSTDWFLPSITSHCSFVPYLAADFWQMVGWWPHYEYNRKKTESIYYVMQKHLCHFQNEKQSSFKLMGEQTSSKQTVCLPQHIISFSLRCRQLPSAGVITETWAEAIVQLNSTAVACLHNTWNKCRHIAFTKPCY